MGQITEALDYYNQSLDLYRQIAQFPGISVIARLGEAQVLDAIGEAKIYTGVGNEVQNLIQSSEALTRDQFIIDFYEKLNETNFLSDTPNESTNRYLHPTKLTIHPSNFLDYSVESQSDAVTDLGLDFDLQMDFE